MDCWSDDVDVVLVNVVEAVIFGEVVIVGGMARVFCDLFDVWWWNDGVEVVIEVVEVDVEKSFGDVHHGKVEGSVIVVAWSWVVAKVMPMESELARLELKGDCDQVL